jgi:hypothetical protein
LLRKADRERVAGIPVAQVFERATPGVAPGAYKITDARTLEGTCDVIALGVLILARAGLLRAFVDVIAARARREAIALKPSRAGAQHVATREAVGIPALAARASHTRIARAFVDAIGHTGLRTCSKLSVVREGITVRIFRSKSGAACRRLALRTTAPLQFWRIEHGVDAGAVSNRSACRRARTGETTLAPGLAETVARPVGGLRMAGDALLL